ncbi:MAG TPA: 23S rRNA (adenine(2503)-C(2))-methyltransferase RlmN [Rhizomicrobium sp.]|jgi:23S rRNA (adenine2503-C2)-methyltransferase|nr:23S rRNA (adenine(2503)-C(2))-methyltransferase RlmN [Rhizomicrobium sp.]
MPPATCKSLIGLSPAELSAALTESGVPEKAARMRVRQLWNWTYVHGARDFAGMSNLAKDFREEMTGKFTLARPEVVTEQISSDGTRKWLLRTGPGIEFETVYIPEAERGTLCVSSQVGCTLNCRFCHTGTQKLVRNLTPDEIVGQLLVARDSLNDWPSTAPGRKVTNVVMMGMGEPLYNFDNVKAALAIVTDGDGLALSKRRVTLSTAGVVPMIARAGAEIGSGLAISLHAVNDELRDVIVPINKKYPLKDLMAAIRTYPGASNSRRVTFEYVMLKGVNDSLAEARALVRLVAGIPAKINLIPFNPWPGAPYECSDWSQIEKFAEIVNKAGYASPVRTPRGRDIMAACGQLKSESVKERASARLAAEKLAAVQSGQLARMPS